MHASSLRSENLRLRKAKWTSEEDKLLVHAVEVFGTESWIKICQMVPGRTGKQCRERWIGQLSPQVSKTTWSEIEDKLLLELHNDFGNKWTSISKYLKGRSAISVKNRWNWLIRHNVTHGRHMSSTSSDECSSPKPAICEFLPHDPLLMFGNEHFGKAFEEFQAQLMLGSLTTPIRSV